MYEQYYFVLYLSVSINDLNKTSCVKIALRNMSKYYNVQNVVTNDHNIKEKKTTNYLFLYYIETCFKIIWFILMFQLKYKINV